MISQVVSAGLAVVIPIVIVALIVFAIVALVTARRDPDPAGSRPYAVYLVLIIFFSMFTGLFALTSMASSIAKAAEGNGSVGLICPPITPCAQVRAASGWTAHPPRGFRVLGRVSVGHYGPFDLTKQEVAAAVEAALVALVAIAVLWFHVVRLRELVQDPAFNRSAGRRTYQVYLHAVSFTAAATFIFAAAAALYAIFRIAAPGYTEQLAPSSVERDGGIVQLVSAGFLALGSWAIFRYHWRRTQTLRGDNPLPPAHQVAPPSPPRHGPRSPGAWAPPPAGAPEPAPPPATRPPEPPPPAPVPPEEPPAEAPPAETPPADATPAAEPSAPQDTAGPERLSGPPSA